MSKPTNLGWTLDFHLFLFLNFPVVTSDNDTSKHINNKKANKDDTGNME